MDKLFQVIGSFAAILGIVGAVYKFVRWTKKRRAPFPLDDRFKEGIIEIMKRHSDPAEDQEPHLVFVGYYSHNYRVPPIVYRDPLFASKTVPHLHLATADDREEIYHNFVPKLFGIVTRLNRQLEVLRQESLERVVFDTAHGGCFYFQINEEQYLFGVCLYQQNMDMANTAMQKIRKEIKGYTGELALESLRSKDEPEQRGSVQKGDTTA